MKTILLRLLAASMCVAWVLTLSVSEAVWAQETKKKEEVAEEAEEGDAEVAIARRRYGPNKASARVGEEDIFILAGRPDTEKDPGYAAIDSIKTGEIVEMTLGQAIKFSTPFDVKFGSLAIKEGNVAPNYPGVYSLWMKKTATGWNIVFNEKPDIWGTMHDKKADVGETAAKYAVLPEPVKGIKLEMKAGNGKGMLSISWGKHQWSAPFTIES